MAEMVCRSNKLVRSCVRVCPGVLYLARSKFGSHTPTQVSQEERRRVPGWNGPCTTFFSEWADGIKLTETIMNSHPTNQTTSDNLQERCYMDGMNWIPCKMSLLPQLMRTIGTNDLFLILTPWIAGHPDTYAWTKPSLGMMSIVFVARLMPRYVSMSLLMTESWSPRGKVWDECTPKRTAVEAKSDERVPECTRNKASGNCRCFTACRVTWTWTSRDWLGINVDTVSTQKSSRQEGCRPLICF